MKGDNAKDIWVIRFLIIIFMTGLIISGVTAFPIETLLKESVSFSAYISKEGELTSWLTQAYFAVRNTNVHYPFLAYGTDWLAFAHLVIALAFVGPLRDPQKNIWVVEFGLIACIGVFPLAFIAGSVRGIPFFWQCIDCSFGIVGGILLWVIYTRIKEFDRERQDSLTV